MRYPKEFEYTGENRRKLTGAPVVVIQWNTGAKKNFCVERYKKPIRLITIPGKGDEVMKKAIEKAYELSSL